MQLSRRGLGKAADAAVVAEAVAVAAVVAEVAAVVVGGDVAALRFLQRWLE